MLFIMVVTLWGLVVDIMERSASGGFVLVAIDVIALILEGWMVVEGAIIMVKTRRQRAAKAGPAPELDAVGSGTPAE